MFVTDILAIAFDYADEASDEVFAGDQTWVYLAMKGDRIIILVFAGDSDQAANGARLYDEHNGTCSLLFDTGPADGRSESDIIRGWAATLGAI